MKLATVFVIGSIGLFAFSAAEAKDRDQRRTEGKSREQRSHVVRDARNRSPAPARAASGARHDRSASGQRDEHRDARSDRSRDDRQGHRSGNQRNEGRRSEGRRDEGRRDVQRIIPSERRDAHGHRREGDVRREESYSGHAYDGRRHDNQNHRRHEFRYDDHRHSSHNHKKHKKYPHHHGHTIVRREHYVRHNLVSIDNFWDGIFLGAVLHVAYHDGMFCRNRYHDHYRSHYYWEDELGYCYRVEPGHRRDHFIEVPQYMCY